MSMQLAKQLFGWPAIQQRRTAGMYKFRGSNSNSIRIQNQICKVFHQHWIGWIHKHAIRMQLQTPAAGLSNEEARRGESMCHWTLKSQPCSCPQLTQMLCTVHKHQTILLSSHVVTEHPPNTSCMPVRSWRPKWSQNRGEIFYMMAVSVSLLAHYPSHHHHSPFILLQPLLISGSAQWTALYVRPAASSSSKEGTRGPIMWFLQHLSIRCKCLLPGIFSFLLFIHSKPWFWIVRLVILTGIAHICKQNLQL